MTLLLLNIESVVIRNNDATPVLRSGSASFRFICIKGNTVISTHKYGTWNAHVGSGG